VFSLIASGRVLDMFAELIIKFLLLPGTKIPRLPKKQTDVLD
jgi:hypothetical protein